MFKAGFQKCHRRPQHRLPLGCELRALPTHPYLPRIPPKCRDNGNCTVCSGVHDPASCETRFTRGHVRELKNGHNSITIQNRTHVYMNFFHHKGLGNHLLQLCPKVVKHPVYKLLLCPLFWGCTGQQAKCGRGLECIKLCEVRLHTFLNMFIIN